MSKCPKCGSKTAQHKIGFTAAGSQRYKCQACGRKYTPVPKPKGYPQEIRWQAVRMHLGGQSYHQIGQALGVDHASVINWVRAHAEQAATAPDTPMNHVPPKQRTRPVPPPQIVERPRLYAILDQWQTMPVIFLHAPAGYGKSILVSRWLEVRKLGSRTAWLSLGPGDNQPVPFVRGVAAALDSVIPGIAHAVRPLLDVPDAHPRRALRVLLAALESGPHRADDVPLLLVLDDLHHADSPALHPLMTLALEHRPRRLHFILLARPSTYEPLVRLYAQGQVCDITAADLRFLPDEMATYLVQRGFPPPGPDKLETLARRTEGWIVTLQLAAAAVRESHNIDELIAATQSRRGRLAEYLTNQILVGLPLTQREFLWQTSILERFNSFLAAAVSGNNAADVYLSAAIEAGLPVVQLDNRQEWFRYHHLFQELLLTRLRQEYDSATISNLHRRAATWLAQHDEITPAVQHALATEDLPLAAAILEAALRPEILRGGTDRAEYWLSLFPSCSLDQHPRLLLEWSLLGVLDNRSSLPDLIARTEAALATSPLADAAHRRAQAELHVFKAVAFLIGGDVAAAKETTRVVAEHVADLDQVDQGIHSFMQMILAWIEGQGRRALDPGGRAIQAFRRAGFDRGVTSVLREQALISAHCGIPYDALALLQEARAIAQPSDSFTIRESISALVAASNLHYWIDDVEGAKRDQQAALVLARGLADSSLACELASLARLFALTRADNASQEIGDSWPVAGKSSIPLLNRLRLHQLVCQGQVERAWQFAALLGVKIDQDITNWHLPDIASSLEASIARGIDLDVTVPRLAAAIDRAKQIDSRLLVAELYALSAWCHLRLRGREEALDDLACALDLALETGYVRFILDIPALAPLLAVVDHPAAGQFWVATVPYPQRRQAAQLTDRERLILAQLTQPARYQDIADAFGVSINTVRTHVRHIYAKLGVAKRKDAITRAQAMGLVPRRE